MSKESKGEKMNHIAAIEELIASERMRRKLEEISAAFQAHLAPVEDHINFTFQECFKCARECFDRRRREEEISNCLENCSVPVARFLHHTAKFQERLNRSLKVCEDKFKSAKLEKIRTDAINDLESCIDQSIDDSIKTVPHVVGKMKSDFSIKD